MATAAADELLLLERVFLRIGSAETDEQLQNAVSKFLPPVLLKLSSQQEGVRKKVMELLVHINKRIKSRPVVQLPVEALLLQYQDPSASSFVINFTIIYIKLGFPRLPIEKQTELVPSVLNALDSKPQSHQDSLLMLIVPILGQVTVPTDPEKRTSLFGLNEKPVVAKQLANVLLDMLLLPYGATVPSQSDSSTSTSQFPTPPGMSPYTFKRITGGSDSPGISLKPDQLEQIKLGIVRFLACNVYADHDILAHLVVAAADTRFSVANLADLELKKIVGGLNWGCPALATPLYRLFLGSQGNVKPEHKKLPVSTRIRLKLLHYLCRVTGAAFVMPPCIQVVFDSLYGTNTNTKLKSLALTFTTNIIQQTEKQTLEPVGRLLLCGLTKLTEEGETQHQSQAYIILGLLGRRLPTLFADDLALLENLFKKLSSESTSADMKLPIREGLLNLTVAYKESASSNFMLLLSLLKQYVDDNEPMARFVAVKFIATIFPLQHVESKFLLLLSTNDSKDDISSEALKSLYGLFLKQNFNDSSNDNNKSLQLPAFNELIQFINTEVKLRLQKPSKCYSQGNHLLPFSPAVYKEILIYLRLCLLQEVNIPHTREVLRHPNELTTKVAKYLQIYMQNDLSEKNLVQYLQFAKQLLKVQPSLETLSCILEVVGCIPIMHQFFLENVQSLRDLLNSTREEIREISSTFFGIIIANGLGVNDFNGALNELLSDIESNKSLEVRHGSILGAANALERRIMIKNAFCSDLFERNVLLSKDILKSNVAVLVDGACVSLGLLGRCAPLPLDVNAKLEVVNQLLQIVCNSKLTSRVRKRSIQSLGLIVAGEEDFPHIEHILKYFIDNISDFRDLELQLAVGDSLVICLTTKEIQDPWCNIENELVIDLGRKDKYMENMIEKLLTTVENTQPNNKQAAALWLLAMLRNYAEHPPFKSRLQRLQSTFVNLLSDSNELVVDIASRALSIVFEAAELSESNILLGQLITQLQASRKEGGIATYGELCTLASDINQPALLYPLLQLATFSASLQMKQDSEKHNSAVEKLVPHLSQLVPRLYRLQFDPTGLQVSMQRIWRTLITDTSQIVLEHRDVILSELVDNLSADVWRVRHACCLALTDLFTLAGIHGAHSCLHIWPLLWSELFRVMDDIHESTRLAAVSTAAHLSKLCVRACDPNHSPTNGDKLLHILLPIFLDQGIGSSAAEVRAVALHTIAQLVDVAGVLLRAHLIHLIPALLQAAGELESTKLSYISSMYAGNSSTQDFIDSIRAGAAKSHYTTETVTKCLQYIDSDTLDMLLPKVLDLMKTTPSLGSRVACAHFLSLLAVQLRPQLTPHAGRCLTVLVSGLMDRNTAIRKCYAVALGHMMAIAKDSSVEKVFRKLRTWYFEREDENTKAVCAYAMQAILNHAQDCLQSNKDIVMPLVFFAMHAEQTPENKNVVEIWHDIWSENTPGSETGIKQNIEAICLILQEALESPSWMMKAQAANAIAMVATKLGASLEVRHQNLLFNILISGLSGRIWNGKEKLLNALSCICINCKNSLKIDPEINLVLVVDTIMKECTKNDLNYKRVALQAAGDILASLEFDRFEELYNTVQNILAKDSPQYSDDEELSSEETIKRREDLIKLRETIYETLGKAWPTNVNTQKKYGDLFVTHCTERLPISTRSIQVSIMMALCQYVDKLAEFQTETSTEVNNENFQRILMQIVEALTYALNISKHTRLRKEALNVVLSLTKKLKDKKRFEDLDYVKMKFNEVLLNLENDHQPEIKSRLVDLKILFQN